MAWGKEWVDPTFTTKAERLDDVTDIKFKKQGSNLVDDNQYLYFQCESCDKLFDPHTKSFATLNQKRYDAGWKVKWNLSGMGYKVYCVECGKNVE